ncbi:MAG: shikimate dehydrogenase [Alphaproteobacteria bacterium]|nr:shikimate dehydrogenase [Alphaproteobacteria bacterium]
MPSSIPRAGIIGWPVSHSRSPILHTYWLRKYALAGSYERIPISPENFAAQFRSLSDQGFAGANVTIPHKQTAMACCDELEPAAKRLGAVNTIVITQGRYHGSNTDGYGFIENLRQRAPHWRADTGPAVIIGAGGAARAVVAALIDAGAKQLRLFNRTRSRADQLAADLGGPVETADWQRLDSGLADCSLLVNCSSLGMTGQPPLEISLRALPPTALVYDLVYTPLQTPLLKAASHNGNPTIDGLGMLIHQARPGFAAWFGVMPEADESLLQLLLSDIESTKGI